MTKTKTHRLLLDTTEYELLLDLVRDAKDRCRLDAAVARASGAHPAMQVHTAAAEVFASLFDTLYTQGK